MFQSECNVLCATQKDVIEVHNEDLNSHYNSLQQQNLELELQISILQTEKEALEIDLANSESGSNHVKEDLLRLSLIVLPPSAEKQKMIHFLRVLSVDEAKDSAQLCEYNCTKLLSSISKSELELGRNDEVCNTKQIR